MSASPTRATPMGRSRPFEMTYSPAGTKDRSALSRQLIHSVGKGKGAVGFSVAHGAEIGHIHVGDGGSLPVKFRFDKLWRAILRIIVFAASKTAAFEYSETSSRIRRAFTFFVPGKCVFAGAVSTDTPKRQGLRQKSRVPKL